MKHLTLSTIWRLAFLPLIFCELLAVLGVFDIQVTYTTLGLLITSTAVFTTIEIVHRYTPPSSHVRLSWWSVLPVVAAIFFDAGGDFFHWYTLYTYFDTALHFFGTFAATAFTWNIVTIFLRSKADNSILLWATGTTGISLGVIYEIEEYLEDVFTESNRLGDGPDTGNDLTMDTIGALLFVVLVIVHHRRKHNKKSS